MDDRPAMRRCCRRQARCTVTDSHRKRTGCWQFWSAAVCGRGSGSVGHGWVRCCSIFCASWQGTAWQKQSNVLDVDVLIVSPVLCMIDIIGFDRRLCIQARMSQQNLYVWRSSFILCISGGCLWLLYIC
ncbi:hypothetical protein PAHAL_6G021900 [Panicum hallii]|uniref:Uncharacterized protein n=2 Tax=Panicum hallii TaxID=206008 RepID=A0A2T8IEV6_9POAL|nr:hypothetical protein PAHAL_6G021900 [Panicum hallii]